MAQWSELCFSDCIQLYANGNETIIPTAGYARIDHKKRVHILVNESHRCAGIDWKIHIQQWPVTSNYLLTLIITKW